jgi:hypothetical protein
MGLKKCKSFSLKNHSKIADWKLLSHSFNSIFNERVDSISLYFTQTNGRTFFCNDETQSLTNTSFFQKIPEFENKKILLKSYLSLKNSVSRFSVQNRLTKCKVFSPKKKSFTRFQWKSFIQSSWFDTLNGRKTVKLCHFSFKSLNFLFFLLNKFQTPKKRIESFQEIESVPV